MSNINVQVSPRASVEKVVKTNEDTYKIYTFKPAVDGEANKRVIELLAEHLGVKKNQVILKMGLKSKHKVFEIK